MLPRMFSYSGSLGHFTKARSTLEDILRPEIQRVSDMISTAPVLQSSSLDTNTLEQSQACSRKRVLSSLPDTMKQVRVEGQSYVYTFCFKGDAKPSDDDPHEISEVNTVVPSMEECSSNMYTSRMITHLASLEDPSHNHDHQATEKNENPRINVILDLKAQRGQAHTSGREADTQRSKLRIQPCIPTRLDSCGIYKLLVNIAKI
ncbi:hypothetical protein BJ508DRAFT_305019 [Ascobolus immersus RN42]|uniref:Uncharacterized protein n=1 Tax=Ascobolus immersus RN42 TaxID=1160509 RepID=A0A3N4IA80_ASCIM|nr:hypothetical protein BJ508DRAFT_305019 [Ascobolus immersus RN42]